MTLTITFFFALTIVPIHGGRTHFFRTSSVPAQDKRTRLLEENQITTKKVTVASCAETKVPFNDQTYAFHVTRLERSDDENDEKG